ncbi:hypothetical protein M422DRAFT_207261 [Sphaerobolus stellatus SS14]|uniref:UvrD-like helicase ATP-binding domain-containing protein n=1 Tax=Sphaerobolus stellatus (strain SS14) TaxID=990650 RepID=A0A0C9W0U8_SPHS4|nr:hypothetical protein M422DRAFT_207261 [Sphaerobolus stellatus SS14]
MSCSSTPESLSGSPSTPTSTESSGPSDYPGSCIIDMTKRKGLHDIPKFNYELFKPEQLSSEEGLQAALVFVDKFLDRQNPQSARELYKHLYQGSTYLLEYTLVVALDDARFNLFSSILLDSTSFMIKEYLDSLAFEFTEYLGKLFMRLVQVDLPRELMNLHHDFNEYTKVLRAINTLAFDKLEISDKEKDTMIIPSRKQSGQGARKQARRLQDARPKVDPAVFQGLGYSVPKSSTEATHITHRCIVKFKEILEEYLNILRGPALSAYFKSVYVDERVRSPASCGLQSSGVTRDDANSPVDSVSTPETYPAYPHIQPLKAAKYFSEPADGFGPWPLMLSNRAIQHLKSYRREDQKIWDILRIKLQQLSQGFFSDDNQKLLTGISQDIPIYEAKATRDLRIIYQVDVVPNSETGRYHQVLRVWGIHTHAQIDKRLWSAVARHQGQSGSEYRRRCLYRATPKTQGKNIIFPHSWEEHAAIVPTETIIDETMNVEDQLELHSILTLEKFIKMSQSVLNTIVADQDATFPFELTKAEQDIRDHGSSCFVLGRSGTGKTTTMVFKMMNYEMLKTQQSKGDSSNAVQYRQLFVTQSRILASRVQDYFHKMMISSMTGLKNAADLERLAQQNHPEKENGNMMELEDDEDDERADLPKRFSELQDHHFPLFLTVDQLCRLLENDCNLSFKRGPRTNEHRRAEKTSYTLNVDRNMDLEDKDDESANEDAEQTRMVNRSSSKSPIVTFDTFRYGYWPHFAQNLTKGLEPALVYNEFLGVIKGSEETLHNGHDSNCLDRTTYVNLSERRQSTFARQREQIYDLFERYTKMKAERGDYDAADRTHALLRSLPEHWSTKHKVDFLYVDEVQDNLIVDARLLRELCRNPDGLFWAGDTAQTISMGSSFRFDDLKAFVFRLEEKMAQAIGRAHVQPASFHLAINYRSHAGVVNCAHSVVELITHFWPHSIDNLPRERGLVEGPRPVFFGGWDTEDANYEQFFFHESLNIELGAQQCILVRNDQAREQLRRQIGDVGLIMTMYEAKGLEFNDVLLYNFFADSTASLSEWRVVLNKVNGKDFTQGKVPRFDDARHASLCSELKFLYVGITRARSHVWILDGSDKSEPIRIYWESQKLIQICRPGDPLPKLAVKSTPEQWARQGHALFKQKLFRHAAQCFSHAGLVLERCIALAYLQRQTAKRSNLQHGKTTATAAAYGRAAEQFIVCANMAVNATMRTRYFVMGAEMFSLAELPVKAGQTYFIAGRFTEAVHHFKKAKMYEEAAEITLLHGDQVDSKLAEECTRIAKVYWHRQGQLQKAARLFQDVEEHLEYLEDYGFENSKVSLLQSLDRWDDLGQLHMESGRHLEAIPCWLRGGTDESRMKAVNSLFDWLWQSFPLGTTATITDADRQTIKDIIEQLQNNLHPTQMEEFSMFKAILEHDSKRLRNIARMSEVKLDVALLCLDQYLATPPPLQNDTPEDVVEHLEDYLRYAGLTRSVISNWQNPDAQRLLGLTKDSDSTSTHQVSTKSILYKHLKHPESEDVDDPITANNDIIQKKIRQVLGYRLRDRLDDEHRICIRAKAFRPCLNIIVHGSCYRSNCPNDHIPRESLTVETINVRIRLHLLQLQVVQRLDIFCERRLTCGSWLRRFYATVFPPHFALGNPSISTPKHIPEYHSLMETMCSSLHEQLFDLQLYKRKEENLRFITDLVSILTIAFTFDSKRAKEYTWRASCIGVLRPPRILVSSYGGRDVYIAHSILDFFMDFSTTSIVNGAGFIRDILQRQLTIDVDVLICLIELVISATILASRKYLNGLTLPRSWILDLLSKGEPLGDITCTFTVFRTVSEVLKTLAKSLYMGKGVEYLVDDRHNPVSDATPQILRTVWVSRIYRCLVLLGYNLSGYREALRGDIVNILTCFNDVSRPLPSIITRYVTARNWDDATRALRSSVDSPTDELVQLCRADAIPPIPPKGVRIVSFKAETQILPALAYAPIIQLDPEAVAFIPKGLQTLEEEGDEGDENDPSATLEEAQVVPKDRSIPITQGEFDAANVIHTWYIRQRDRKNKKSRISAFAANFYAQCCTEVSKVVKCSRYRMMYLGPLPHALAALHGCGEAINKAKKRHNKSMLGKESMDVERISDMLTIYSKLRKEHLRLSKELKPDSKLHEKGSVIELAEKVQAVKDLLEDAEKVLYLDNFKEDMDIGYKGITQPKGPPSSSPVKTMRRPSLPSLNTEDL